MLDILQSTLNAVLDRSPKELLGGVLVALALAIAMAGLYALGRRKVGEPLTLVVGLMLFANVAAMALAIGYLEHSQRNYRQSIERVEIHGPHHPGALGRELGMSQRILDVADTNKDGSL